MNKENKESPAAAAVNVRVRKNEGETSPPPSLGKQQRTQLQKRQKPQIEALSSFKLLT